MNDASRARSAICFYPFADTATWTQGGEGPEAFHRQSRGDAGEAGISFPPGPDAPRTTPGRGTSETRFISRRIRGQAGAAGALVS